MFWNPCTILNPPHFITVYDWTHIALFSWIFSVNKVFEKTESLRVFSSYDAIFFVKWLLLTHETNLVVSK